MRFLSAHRIFNGREFLPGRTVVVIDGQKKITDILGYDAIDPLKIQAFEGILCPGFVNAHCHLELSHLHNKIPQGTGFAGFASSVVASRNNMPAEEAIEHMRDADNYLHARGIVAVGDICNNSSSFAVKRDSQICYHSFIEVIGLNPAAATTIFARGLELLHQLNETGQNGSLSPHAPYSTSIELIAEIAGHNQRHSLPTTIHNQETIEENRFFEGKKSGIHSLYEKLGLDISWFKAPGITSLRHYRDSLTESRSLLVHNTFTSADEVHECRENIYWCFCPTANLYIEKTLPTFSNFSGRETKLCAGTDSLASNYNLDLVKEVNHLLYQPFALADVLRMMTANGAEALGISEKIGCFKTNMTPGINLVDEQDNKIIFKQKIV